MFSRFRQGTLVLLALAFTFALLPAAPAQAAIAANIRDFHATCSAFSVRFDLSGATDDINGYDLVRYVVTDGTGKVLYEETSARQTNTTASGSVTALPYASATPTENPIRFSIIDVSTTGKPVSTIARMETNSSCFAPVSRADYLFSLLPQGVKGSTRAATALYGTPNGAPLGLTVEGQREFTGIYRTTDNTWVALYVGGENLVWVRAGDMDINVGGLQVLPTRIDRSQQVTGAVIPGPAVATARLNYTLNFRAAPSLSGRRLGRVPFRSVVAVYGRSANSGWILIQYNGVAGWIASRYVTLDVPLRELPVVGS